MAKKQHRARRPVLSSAQNAHSVGETIWGMSLDLWKTRLRPAVPPAQRPRMYSLPSRLDLSPKYVRHRATETLNSDNIQLSA